MGLEALGIVFFIVVVILLVLLRKKEAVSRPIAAQPVAENNPSLAAGASMEFIAMLSDINDLRRNNSPELQGITELGRLLGQLYASCITTLQKKHIEVNLAQALVGKRVSWHLKVSDVVERPIFFWTESTGMSGPWIQLTQHRLLLVAQCQTLSRADLVYLQPGQSVVAAGRIAKVKIQWPTILLMVVDATVSRTSDDRTVPPETGALLGAEPTSPLQPTSVTPQFQTSRINSVDFNEEPSYQTAPLDEYSSDLRGVADELFEIVSQQIGHRAKRYKGSFSVLANSSSETAAKIVIYQQGLGRENGKWPVFADGIYVLVRCNGGAGRAIWDGDLLRSSAYQRRLDPERTLGIAPKRDERFAYFRLEPEDESRVVAELLVACASA